MGSKYSPEDSDEFKDEDFNELATRADEKVKKAAWKIKHRQDRAVERKRRQAETPFQRKATVEAKLPRAMMHTMKTMKQSKIIFHAAQ